MRKKEKLSWKKLDLFFAIFLLLMTKTSKLLRNVMWDEPQDCKPNNYYFLTQPLCSCNVLECSEHINGEGLAIQLRNYLDMAIGNMKHQFDEGEILFREAQGFWVTELVAAG